MKPFTFFLFLVPILAIFIQGTLINAEEAEEAEQADLAQYRGDLGFRRSASVGVAASRGGASVSVASSRNGNRRGVRRGNRYRYRRGQRSASSPVVTSKPPVKKNQQRRRQLSHRNSLHPETTRSGKRSASVGVAAGRGSASVSVAAG